MRVKDRLAESQCTPCLAAAWTKALSNPLFQTKVFMLSDVQVPTCSYLHISRSGCSPNSTAFVKTDSASDRLEVPSWIWFVTMFNTILFVIFSMFTNHQKMECILTSKLQYLVSLRRLSSEEIDHLLLTLKNRLIYLLENQFRVRCKSRSAHWLVVNCFKQGMKMNQLHFIIVCIWWVCIQWINPIMNINGNAKGSGWT